MAIYILEDNMMQANYLRKIIEKISMSPGSQIYLYSKYDELVERVQLRNECNIYFIDISLRNNKEGGFIAAGEIRKIDKNGLVVIVSSHLELAYRSYKYLINAYTFINKNEDLNLFVEEVKQCLQKYTDSKLNRCDEEVVTLTLKSKIYRIQLKKILYFKSIGMHRILLVGDNLCKEFYGSLKEIEILHSKFIRVHHSFVVYVENIKSIDKKNRVLLVINGDSIPISRNKLKEVLAIIM